MTKSFIRELPTTTSEIEFGTGRGLGEIVASPSFKEPEELAKALGWASGCPVPDMLISERGAEPAARRYGQLIYGYSYLTEKVASVNPELAVELQRVIPRKEDEPAGLFEPQSVPDNYDKEMSPLTTLSGYALARLFVEHTGTNDKSLSPQERTQKLNAANELLRESASFVSYPPDLVAVYAEGAAEDIGAAKVLQIVLPRGWHDEHQSQSMLKSTKASIRVMAPSLWHAYEQMDVEVRDNLGII